MPFASITFARISQGTYFVKDTKQKDVQTNTPHFKTNYYVLGILLVLGSEFVLRAVLLPKQANGFDVGLVLIIEWVVLAMLMAVWLPRVEKLLVFGQDMEKSESVIALLVFPMSLCHV